MAKLPPLTSLQAFEAVARHESIKLAAEELSLSPTAMSHRLKTLEDFLGLQLFHRMDRSLKITSDGERLYPFVGKAFQQITQGIESLEKDELKGELLVTTTNSFAWSWLSPRLPNFTQLYPDLNVKVMASDSLINAPQHSIDVAIRYMDKPDPDVHAAWVLDDYVIPICAKEQSQNIDSPQDLLSQNLIEYEWIGFKPGHPNWGTWFKAVGIDSSNIKTIASYSDEIMCIEAAIDNHAIALVGVIAASREIERGRVVAPLPQAQKDRSYYMICPLEKAQSAKIRAFQDWLLSEADLFRDSPYGLKFMAED